MREGSANLDYSLWGLADQDSAEARCPKDVEMVANRLYREEPMFVSGSLGHRLRPLPTLPPLPSIFNSLPSVDILLEHSPPIQRLARLTDYALKSYVSKIRHNSPVPIGNGGGGGASASTIFIYREDLCSHLAPAGNKLRKLAYILPHAIAESDPPVSHLVVEGGVQSNCCRQTAMAAAHLGLKCIAVLNNDVEHDSDSGLYTSAGNVQLERLLGAEVRHLDHSSTQKSLTEQTQRIVDEVNSIEGQRAFFIPTGGSLAPSGGVGYARWVFEMLEKEAHMRAEGQLGGSGRFDNIVVACASGSTLAGIIAGMRLAIKSGWVDADAQRRVVGVEVFALPIRSQRERVLGIAQSTAKLIGLKQEDITLDDIELDGRWTAGAYGRCDARTRQTLKTVAQTEAIFLDPAYTGKAMTAVLDAVAGGEMTGNVLFVHTGGQASLPAYAGIECDE